MLLVPAFTGASQRRENHSRACCAAAAATCQGERAATRLGGEGAGRVCGKGSCRGCRADSNLSRSPTLEVFLSLRHAERRNRLAEGERTKYKEEPGACPWKQILVLLLPPLSLSSAPLSSLFLVVYFLIVPWLHV